MTTSPEKTETHHHLLAGLPDQGRFARELARAGRTEEAVEHLDAIARLSMAYREATGEKDTLPEWLYQRFARYRVHAPAWSALSEDDQAYWAHEAAAVRRAVARGGFKDGGV